ncbi:GNAT family N-acetyltransferase [Furfurilactobacillus curtus]|uniref:Ribosomal protein acetylating enzyme n=1 Tax=Furfurilactobacillus curtus TaxID=1746200 RepID=A0ABQ5JM66_9LACO
MFTHQIDAHLALKLMTEEDADYLFDIIEQDRRQLRRWMPWTDATQTVADELKFIRFARQKFASNEMLPLTIVIDGLPVGCIDLHRIDREQQHAEVGYWLKAKAQGHGVMTRSVNRLLTIGFDELNLHKIMLRADVDNHPSQAVAQRLGMQQEGVLRDHVLVNNEFRSLVVFSTLENEWEAHE